MSTCTLYMCMYKQVQSSRIGKVLGLAHEPDNCHNWHSMCQSIELHVYVTHSLLLTNLGIIMWGKKIQHRSQLISKETLIDKTLQKMGQLNRLVVCLKNSNTGIAGHVPRQWNRLFYFFLFSFTNLVVAILVCCYNQRAKQFHVAHASKFALQEAMQCECTY